jgi:hypothetical protein
MHRPYRDTIVFLSACHRWRMTSHLFNYKHWSNIRFYTISIVTSADKCTHILLMLWISYNSRVIYRPFNVTCVDAVDDIRAEPISRPKTFVPLAPQTYGNAWTERLLFSRTNTWFCVHTAHQYLDLCTTKVGWLRRISNSSNQISILYSINMSF